MTGTQNKMLGRLQYIHNRTACGSFLRIHKSCLVSKYVGVHDTQLSQSECLRKMYIFQLFFHFSDFYSYSPSFVVSFVFCIVFFFSFVSILPSSIPLFYTTPFLHILPNISPRPSFPAWNTHDITQCVSSEAVMYTNGIQSLSPHQRKEDDGWVLKGSCVLWKNWRNKTNSYKIHHETRRSRMKVMILNSPTRLRYLVCMWLAS